MHETTNDHQISGETVRGTLVALRRGVGLPRHPLDTGQLRLSVALSGTLQKPLTGSSARALILKKVVGYAK